MSLAENLLNSLDETAYENMRIAGSGEEEHIIVGQDRSITVPNALKTIAVKGDKDVETATIDCVRYWDGNDLSTFAIYLNYILPNGDEGTYIPKSITKSVDFFTFDWKIGSEFTYSQGKLTFWIVAKLTDNSGTLVRQWSSFQNSDCTIAQGGDKIYVPEKQTDQDVISQAISISRASAETAEQQANLAKEAAEKAATDAREAAEDEVSRIIGELGVVQELGDSPNSVVSQLKVTKEFNKTNTKINRNSKRITNLEQGVAEQFETDASVAYVKDVPANALPYAAVAKVGGMTYKDGDTLKSAKVTEIESVGVNLIPYPYHETTLTRSGVSFTDKGDGGITLSGTATTTSSFNLLTMTGSPMPIGEYYAVSNGVCEIRLYHDDETATTFPVSGGNINVTKPFAGVALLIREGQTYNGTVYPMLNKGKTAQPYRLYTRNTLPIPEAVQVLDGYGEGTSESAYNYIDWEKKQFVKRVERIAFDGTESWKLRSAATSYQYSHFSVKIGVFGTCVDGSNISSHYPTEKIGISTNANGLYVVNSSGYDGAFVNLRDDNFASVDEFKTHLAEQYANGSPLTVYYELATPIITDISDLLPADNLLGVEGGGTVTAVNENAFAVPTEIIYQLKGVAE